VRIAREILGRPVVDEGGDRLGQVIAIVHHADGTSSALLQDGHRPWRRGRMVPLDGLVALDDDLLHLLRPEPGRPAVRALTH